MTQSDITEKRSCKPC